MAKLGFLTLVLGFLGIVTAASLTSEDAAAGAACKRATFETEMVNKACTKGGQAEAKKAMKKFVKKAKKKEAALECKSCHTKLAPNYPLKDGALQHFRDLGGK